MKNKNNIASAIIQYGKSKGFELRPMVDFISTVDCETNGVCRTYSIDWKTDKLRPPTEAELELAEQQAEINEKKYAYIAERKKKYPSIEDQLDMLWHGYENVTQSGSDLSGMFSQWFNALKKIKQQYPKP